MLTLLATASSSGNGSSKSGNKGSGLSNEKIAAIAAVLGVVVASISAWIAWRTYKKRHARPEQKPDDEPGFQLQVLNGTHMRPLGIPEQVFSGGARPDVIYSRSAVLFSTSGVAITSEKFEILRNNRPIDSIQSPSGRILGEV